MKKKLLILLLVLCTGLILTGCDKTKENTNNTKNETKTTEKKTNKETKKSDSIVGKWSYANTFTYVFNEDGTGRYDANGETVLKFTYEINGNKITMKYEDMDTPFNTEYKIDGNTLIIKDSAGEDVRYERD